MHVASKSSVSGSKPGPSIVAALSELAAEVQKRRTVSDVLETAGKGILRLGMRLYAFQVIDEHLVLSYLATARSRLQAIEASVGRPIHGLRAPLADLPLASEVVHRRRIVHRVDLDFFHSFLRSSTGFDPAKLDAAPETAGINNGVLAPIFVREKPWGLLGVISHTLQRADADAIALFATHVGTALEVAEAIDDLAKANRALEECRAAAAVVANEARNPLCVLFNTIGGLRDFLRAGAPAGRLANAELLASMAGEELEQLERMFANLEGRAPASLPFFSRAR